jgi:hypothetical protein
MTDPKPNLDLLRKVLKQIDEHPETWRQSAIAKRTPCGTAYCVAGHAALMSGHEFDWPEMNKTLNACWADNTVDGEEIWDVGRRELGLTSDEAANLFFARNTRECVQVHAQEIAARAGETL